MSRLSEALEHGVFAVTSEVGPPKGRDMTLMMETAHRLADRVVALNVTDNQASVMRLSTLAACVHLQLAGFEPVLQLTGRDRNRLALQSDLLGAASFGIENVLALTGDHVLVGDHPQAKPVFDLESVQILETIRQLNNGNDLSGNPLHGTPNFYPGAVVVPDSNPLPPQMAKFRKKVEAGARYFQTQAVYDPLTFRAFMDVAHDLDVKVLAGIVVLRSARMARFMTKNIPGIRVPEALVKRLESASDPEAEGVAIAAAFIEEVADCCDGVHIMAIGAEHLVDAVLDASGIAEVRA